MSKHKIKLEALQQLETMQNSVRYYVSNNERIPYNIYKQYNAQIKKCKKVGVLATWK